MYTSLGDHLSDNLIFISLVLQNKSIKKKPLNTCMENVHIGN